MSPIVFNLTTEPIPRVVVVSGGGQKLAGLVFTDLEYAMTWASLHYFIHGLNRNLKELFLSLV